MGNPIDVVCPKGVWTLVSSNVVSLVLYIVSNNPSKYLYTYRLTGETAPTLQSGGTGIFHKSYVKKLCFPKPVDIYIWCKASNGIVSAFSEGIPGANDLGSIDVNVQDQTTPPVFVKANQVQGQTTLTANIVSNGLNRTIEVADATGMALNSYVGVFSLTTGRFYTGVIIVLSGTTLTMDNPIDSDFLIGDTIGFGITNMITDGSITPQIFSLRGADPGLPLIIDITRILFTCITTNAVNLSDFGDLPGGLTYGMLIRRVDGFTQNYVNFKTNIEMKGWMLDWDSLDDTNPGQGLHGFVARLTFGGQDKIGVTSRIGPGENLELLNQDNLTAGGTMVSLEAMIEGHVVD